MASKEYLIQDEVIYPQLIEPRVILNEIKPKYIQEFLKPFEYYISTDLTKEFRLNVKIRKKESKKFNPFLRLATPEDAKHIAKIVKDDYEGTYPYKEMEDPKNIEKLIKSENYKFILFLNEERRIVGSICFKIDLKEQKGYIRTFVVRKKWLGKLDAKKAYIAACLLIMNKFRNIISLWWAEFRTADAKAQYITRECGLRPIAWLPNKDRFFDKIESDLLMINYNERRITECRNKEIPHIIPSVMRCYLFSAKKYNLENPRILNSSLENNYEDLRDLNKRIEINKRKDKYNYVEYEFHIKNSTSYFRFLYTPKVKNLEKTKYKVKNPTELFLFLKKFISLANRLDIRYFESYVSAYKPVHQQLFYKMGFIPRGYIPGWQLNHFTGLFDDYILFNSYKYDLEKVELIREGKELLNYIKI